MAWSRIARGSQLTQSLARIASEGGAATSVASARRSAAVLGQCASLSSFHSLAFAGLTERYGAAGAGAGAGQFQLSRGIGTTSPILRPAAEPLTAECSDADESAVPDLGPTRPGEKPRVVVLGTGWAACRLLKDVDTRAYDVVCISPRNHMVFTPLLASTCVGTLEFRSVVEPVSRIQSVLATRPGSYFFLASCSGIDTRRHEVYCTAADSDGLSSNPYRFKVAYDKLVIASGSEPLTFGIKGVAENAIFLREVSHAQEIRRKLLTNLMFSENPGTQPHLFNYIFASSMAVLE
ncbi:hypothetical protein GUJ93_ZPchr0007g6246 [Zizania palustris]|uniref:FAD/NAD(P)-binding domain-containing protein n=1 Tax=Zizania palustris TaxID=103762 RepID=A0A8J5TCX4_ZIZPA|nr:hypothetical protein GUJ93_ZPchr0007g6246 [Zizania palustris]